MLRLAWDCAIGFLCYFVISLLIRFIYSSGHWVGGIIPRLLMLSNGTWRIGHFVFTRVFHLLFLIKCLGYAISASGPVLLLAIAHEFFPSLLGRPAVLVGVFLAALEATLLIMHDVHLMRIPDFRRMLVTSGVHFNYNIAATDKQYLMRLARTQYADEVLPNLLMIIVCYGVIAYCADRLGWLGSVPSASTGSPLGSIAGAATFLRFVAGNPFSLGGGLGPYITGYFAICLLLYTMFFISLSSKLIDEELSTEKISAAIAETEAEIDPENKKALPPA